MIAKAFSSSARSRRRDYGTFQGLRSRGAMLARVRGLVGGLQCGRRSPRRMPLYSRDPELARDWETGRPRGDGFRADCRGETTKIRVSSIDTPELRQPYGFEAALAASKLLPEGSRVTVHRIEHDRYGRLVARVTLTDGRDLGRELVRAGAAWHYVQYSRDPELGRIEAEAREAKRGLWAGAEPEEPAAYRKRTTAGGAGAARSCEAATRCAVGRTGPIGKNCKLSAPDTYGTSRRQAQGCEVTPGRLGALPVICARDRDVLPAERRDMRQVLGGNRRPALVKNLDGPVQVGSIPQYNGGYDQIERHRVQILLQVGVIAD